MNKDEFTSLPAPTALGVIFDMLAATLAHVDRPQIPRPPKYDDRFPKKKGFYVWVSEMTLDDLTWWRGKKAESAAGGGEWAAKDAKWLTKFDKWIEWRRLFPYETWSGTRGEDRATGAPPSRDAALHAWAPRNEPPAPKASPPNGGGGYSNADYAPPDDDEIPFISNVSTSTTELWWSRKLSHV